MRPVALIAVLAAGACVKSSPFVCATNQACVRDGTQGRCEPDDVCSFPDSSCPSGFRFGTHEDADLTDQCVSPGEPLPDAGPPADGGPLPANLLTNPGFETDLVGWDFFNADLTRVAGGHSGSFACQVCSMGAVDYTIDDDPSVVASSATGVTYLASAWVRVPSGPAQPITLHIRERNGSLQVSVETITADATWREIRVMHTTSLPGAEVDVFLGNVDTTTGGCFEVDDITFGQL